MVRKVDALAARAARHHLLLNLHGIFPPSGRERTWPHILTFEGVRGAEYNKFSPVGLPPRHDVNIAFTRMLLGPMDYTPGGFRNVWPPEWRMRDRLPFVMGTRARELAKYVVFQSGLEAISDDPDALRGEAGVEFLAKVPATWHQTLGLSGCMGDHVVVARRNGDNWFIGGLCADEARAISLDLDFLGDGHFQVTRYADPQTAGEAATAVSIDRFSCCPADSIELAMAAFGGCALHVART